MEQDIKTRTLSTPDGRVCLVRQYDGLWHFFDEGGAAHPLAGETEDELVSAWYDCRRARIGQAALAARILTVRPAVIARVRSLRSIKGEGAQARLLLIERAHGALDALGAAWDGLIRLHDAEDLRRWTQYVEEAEALVRSDPKLVPEPEGGWTVEKANKLFGSCALVAGTFTPRSVPATEPHQNAYERNVQQYASTIPADAGPYYVVSGNGSMMGYRWGQQGARGPFEDRMKAVRMAVDLDSSKDTSAFAWKCVTAAEFAALPQK